MLRIKNYPLICIAICLFVFNAGFLSWAWAEKPDSISVVYCQDCTSFDFSDEGGMPSGMIMDHWKLDGIL